MGLAGKTIVTPVETAAAAATAAASVASTCPLEPLSESDSGLSTKDKDQLTELTTCRDLTREELLNDVIEPPTATGDEEEFVDVPTDVDLVLPMELYPVVEDRVET